MHWKGLRRGASEPWLTQTLSVACPVAWRWLAPMPLPGVAWPVGEKVRCALVFHSLGEAQ